jgi:hypothetical protein
MTISLMIPYTYVDYHYVEFRSVTKTNQPSFRETRLIGRRLRWKRNAE